MNKIRKLNDSGLNGVRMASSSKWPFIMTKSYKISMKRTFHFPSRPLNNNLNFHFPPFPHHFYHHRICEPVAADVADERSVKENKNCNNLYLLQLRRRKLIDLAVIFHVLRNFMKIHRRSRLATSSCQNNSRKFIFKLNFLSPPS